MSDETILNLAVFLAGLVVGRLVTNFIAHRAQAKRRAVGVDYLVRRCGGKG